jgi:hypothetical protein
MLNTGTLLPIAHSPPAGPVDIPGILDQLEVVQLLRARPVQPAYSFKHSLVQQAAYESMLLEDRRPHRRSAIDRASVR